MSLDDHSEVEMSCSDHLVPTGCLSQLRFIPSGLDRVVVALIESIILDRCRGLGDESSFRDGVVRFILDQIRRMPDYMSYPFKCLVLLFGAWPLVLKGRLFHRLYPEQRAQQVRAWRDSRLAFLSDFINFYETFAIFALYSARYPPTIPNARMSSTHLAPRVVIPKTDELRTEVVIIGTGPGGAVTAALLAEAGLDVLLVEEGPLLALDSAPHFSRDEIVQKYRNGGITVGMGTDKIAYVEGRCVGGGSEVNRGLYHRTPPEVLDAWRREFAIDGLTDAEMKFHHEACERIARISYLPGMAPPQSLRLYEGAVRLGWKAEEVPRLVSYSNDSETGHPIARKQSMTETFVPRFLNAGGRLLPDTRVLHVSRRAGRWQVRALSGSGGRSARVLDVVADTVIVACGATQTPALLRRSGITRNVGDTLRFHPMLKVVAVFSEEVNLPGQLDPVHQVKEFHPRFSLGCSMSSRPLLALSLVAHPELLEEVDRNWRHMAIYYVQTTGGRGVVRTVPGFEDVLVRMQVDSAGMRDLGEGLQKLGECLLAAGAVALYPLIAGATVMCSPADLNRIPGGLAANGASFSTLHLFSTCPMGQNASKAVTDSFGKVHGVDGLYVSDSSLLPGPTVVNPQGSVMAIAHRNALRFLETYRSRVPKEVKRYSNHPDGEFSASA